MLLFSGPQIASCSTERHIGETVADAVCAISRAVMEYQDGDHPTKAIERFSELMARLYQLWQYTAGYISFEDAVRDYGKIVLRERFGSDVSDAALDELMSWLLLTWAKALRQVLH
jgi:hypothetical protein